MRLNCWLCSSRLDSRLKVRNSRLISSRLMFEYRVCFMDVFYVVFFRLMMMVVVIS